MKYSVSIDVPDLAKGIAFYTDVFGVQEVARPIDVYAVLRGSGGQAFGIIQKPEGSEPAPETDDRRHYTRHWTPVHMDIEVDDFDATLDRLTAAEKELLQQLSVIGRQFPVSLVKQVVTQSEDERHRLLSSLQSKEFLYEQPAFPEVEYIFKHALTKEIAYGTVLQEQRKAL